MNVIYLLSSLIHSKQYMLHRLLQHIGSPVLLRSPFVFLPSSQAPLFPFCQPQQATALVMKASFHPLPSHPFSPSCQPQQSTALVMETLTSQHQLVPEYIQPEASIRQTC